MIGRPSRNTAISVVVPPMSEIAALPPNGLTAISTFSGCGGSCLGYRMAGFKVAWASEFIPSAQETYRGALLRYNADHSVDSTYGYFGAAETLGQITALQMSGDSAITAEYTFPAAFDFTQGFYYRSIFVGRYGTNGPEPGPWTART